MSNYKVKPGESINDVVLNATGTLVNLDAVLTANNFDSWTPVLYAGQLIVIPDSVSIDANALRNTQAYPVCNTSVNNIFTQISDLWELFEDFWILSSGFWDDGRRWIDTKTWID